VSGGAVVAGGGGFIGVHLVRELLGQRSDRSIGRRQTLLRVVSGHIGRREQQLDLSSLEASRKAVRGARCIYNLAADMGGMSCIENTHGALHDNPAGEHAHAGGRER
jgi:GDP-D-mannose 3', 5'-epimerase